MYIYVYIYTHIYVCVYIYIFIYRRLAEPVGDQRTEALAPGAGARHL